MGHRYPQDMEARALQAKNDALRSDQRVRHISDGDALKTYVASYDVIADAGLAAAKSHRKNQTIGSIVLAAMSYALYIYDFNPIAYLVPLGLAMVLAVLIFRDGFNDQADVDSYMERDRQNVDQLAYKRLLALANAQPD